MITVLNIREVESFIKTNISKKAKFQLGINNTINYCNLSIDLSSDFSLNLQDVRSIMNTKFILAFPEFNQGLNPDENYGVVEMYELESYRTLNLDLSSVNVVLEKARVLYAKNLHRFSPISKTKKAIFSIVNSVLHDYIDITPEEYRSSLVFKNIEEGLCRVRVLFKDRESAELFLKLLEKRRNEIFHADKSSVLLDYYNIFSKRISNNSKGNYIVEGYFLY